MRSVIDAHTIKECASRGFDMKDIIREELADYAHEIWAQWANHMITVKGVINKDGSLTLPASCVERWERQIGTPYEFLSDEDKDLDRVKADKILAIISSYPQLCLIK